MSDTESKISSQDTVSDINENANIINVTVYSSNGPKLKFKINKTTQFAKVFKAYSERAGINPDSMIFLRDGDRLQPSDTPQDKEVIDGDFIEVMTKQTGGYRPFSDKKEHGTF